MRRSRLPFFILFLGMGIGTQAQTAKPTPPPLRAAAAIVLEAKTGGVLFAKNPDKRLPPASTTKIMTAWLFARDTKPAQKIVTPPEAAKIAGSALGMAPGETFTARDLLYAMLLQSANDACIAAAKQKEGSVSAFVTRMNEEAQQLALPNTHFINTNGLPARNHYSSARDLALLTRQALGEPAFAAAVRAKTYTVPRANRRPPTKLTNRNELLWTVPGMDGVKTGQTREAGFCFVGSVTRKGRRIITVVLHSPDWQAETRALVKYGFARPPAPAPSPVSGSAARPDSATTTTPGSNRTASDSGGAGAADSGALSGSASAGHGITGQTLPTPSAKQGASSPADPQNRPPQGSALANRQGAGVLESGSGDEAESKAGVTERSGTDAREASPPEPPPHTGRGENRTFAGERTEKTTDSSGRTEWKATGRNAYAWPRFDSPQPHAPPPRFWWLLPLLLLLLLAGCLLSLLARKGKFAMKPGLLWPFARRRTRPEERPTPSESGPTRRRIPVKSEKTAPPFAFVPPQLPRLPVRDWLSGLLENTPRLLEAATRRQARAIIAANPALDLEKAFALLGAPKARARIIGAEILMNAAPRRAEDTLLGVIEDEKTPADVRADATNFLAEETGDRHEEFFLRTFLRDGSLPAARALALLPRLETTTIAALRHVATETKKERDADSDLRARLRSAQAACVLGAQGLMLQDEIKPILDRLPANHREQTLTGTLRGVTTPWAIERMIGLALRGQAAYPALQNLLECDPETVREAFDALPELDSAGRTRAMVLRRLLLGEGEMEPLKKLAEAGDNLANNALKLERLQRWHPSQTTPEARLAATMLTSLRLGFTSHTPEQIAAVFRTVGEEGNDALADAPELIPLRQAYAHPDVYDAVQVALTTEDGPGLLATSLLHDADNQAIQEELAFWSDKLPAEARLPVVQTLALSDAEGARDSLASRTSDPNPSIRSAALRALHAQARSFSAPSESAEMPADHAPVAAMDTPPESALDKAA